MRTARAALAVLLAVAIPVRAETTSDPLWHLLSTSVLAPDAAAVEVEGEGVDDARGLASLQADLLLLSDGFEAFRDEAQVKETLARLEPRMSPELKPFFKDRASSLDAIYRTLAVADYTWARRFPEPPCAPVEARRQLLAGRDGLFQTENGQAAQWLMALLGPQAEGKSADRALDQASFKEKLTAAAYEKRRARARKLTLALASDKAVGAARSRLYCARAAAFEELAVHHRHQETGAVLAVRREARAAPEESVFVVVSNSRRSAATLLQTKSGPVLVTDASAVAGDDHPRLLAYSDNAKGVELAATVIRRDIDLGFAVLTYSGKQSRPALVLAAEVASKGDLVSAVGHAEVSGLWTKSSGLVTKSAPASFQTDAAISADFSGGPVLNGDGAVAGILITRPADTEEGHWPVAVPAAAIARWLEGGATASAPASEVIEDAGTAAILSRTRPSALTETGFSEWDVGQLPPPPPTPPGVCMRYCGDSSPARRSQSTISSGPSYDSGNAELGQALGQLGAVVVLQGIPALFRGISKLFKGREKSASEKRENVLVDNRHYATPTPVQEAPKPSPDPLRPTSLTLAVSRAALAQGEEVEAVATISFAGKEGTRAGHAVSFTAVPGGILNCPPGRTDVSGIARVACQAVIVELDRRFDGLQDETRRRMGMKTAGRVPGKPAKGDKIAELKERFAANQDRLVIEEEKHPPTGTDTPGIDKVIPVSEPEEYVVKGDRVTLSASLDKYQDKADLDILERPCFAGSVPEGGEKIGAVSRYRCRSERPAGASSFGEQGMSKAESPSEDHSPDEGDNKPANESRPDDAPTGTKPIDRAGLTRPQIHGIKHELDAGPTAWVGISPDGDVITADGDGHAINHGPWENLTHHRK